MLSLCRTTKNCAAIIVTAIMLTGAPSRSYAQVTIDASKITCDQFVHGKVGQPRVVAAWLSGFYNGKRDNAIIDTQNFQANLNKLETFCYDEKNFSLPVMQAIEQAMAPAK
jgi:acid stress chaperone HdeB